MLNKKEVPDKYRKPLYDCFEAYKKLMDPNEIPYFIWVAIENDVQKMMDQLRRMEQR